MLRNYFNIQKVVFAFTGTLLPPPTSVEILGSEIYLCWAWKQGGYAFVTCHPDRRVRYLMCILSKVYDDDLETWLHFFDTFCDPEDKGPPVWPQPYGVQDWTFVFDLIDDLDT